MVTFAPVEGDGADRTPAVGSGAVVAPRASTSLPSPVSDEDMTVGPSPGIIALAVLLSVAVAALVVWAVVRHRLRAARSRSRFEAFVELQAVNSALPGPPPPPPPAPFPPPPPPLQGYDIPPVGMAAAAAAMPGLNAGYGGGMPASSPMMGGSMPGGPALGPFPRGVWGPGQDAAAMAAAAAAQQKQQQQQWQQQAEYWGAGLPGNDGRWPAPGAAGQRPRRRRNTFPAMGAQAPGWPRQQYHGGMFSDDWPGGPGAYQSAGDGPRARCQRRASAVDERFGRRPRRRGGDGDGLEGSTLCASSSSSDASKGRDGTGKDKDGGADKSKDE